MKKAVMSILMVAALVFGNEDNNVSVPDTGKDFKDISIVKQTAFVVGFPLIVAGGVLTAVLTPIVYAPVEFVKWIASNSENEPDR